MIRRIRRARRLREAVAERDRRRRERLPDLAWHNYLNAPTYREAREWLVEIWRSKL